MCAVCGCSGAVHEHGHDHDHGHGHGHGHAHAAEPRTVLLERAILEKNDAIAAEGRAWLAQRGVLALNLVSAPGAGKTTLLERVLGTLRGDVPISVIEGDQETSRDAERIRRAGGRVVQINTGTGCHLDAGMVLRALPALDPPRRSIVIIENVGNLVCPALFDLGERAKVVLCSVTEGEDKPIKYPHMFRASDVMIMTKVDLIPHLPFDRDALLGFAREVNPRLRVFEVSATRGDGMDGLCSWLREEADRLD